MPPPACQCTDFNLYIFWYLIMEKKIAVVAFGGNAILKSDEEGHQHEQFRNAAEACDLIAEFIQRGFEIIAVHGNGPQVGNILIQMEEAINKVPAFSLDVCVAMTQGSMGYMLENGITNGLKRLNIDKDVVTISSQVIVDKDDPKMKRPTKPIGPFYTYFRAKELMDEKGWTMNEDSGRGWRKVVASPKPLRILAESTIKAMVEKGAVVIAGGGGGIPVVEADKGIYEGVEAVIDKDHTASLLARSVKADMFTILTEIDIVYYNFGTPNPQPLPRLTVSKAKEYLLEGQFPEGSMGPKIQSAVDFIESGGKEVLITSASVLKEALAGKAGTRIVPDDK
jgi:carbamate kinase